MRISECVQLSEVFWGGVSFPLSVTFLLPTSEISASPSSVSGLIFPINDRLWKHEKEAVII